MKTGQQKALSVLAILLFSSFVAQPAFALELTRSNDRQARALLQAATTLQDLVKPGGLTSSLLGPNGLVGSLVKNLNLDQVVQLIPVLQELENVLNRLALPGNVLSGLLGPGGVVDKLIGPTGTLNGLLLGLGLSQALQLTPVLISLQAVLNTLAGPSGGGGAGSPGDGAAAVGQLMGAAAESPAALQSLVGGLSLRRKLLQDDNELQNLLKEGGLVDLLLGPKGLVGDLITKLNLDQVIQILPVLAELQNVLRRLALPGNVLSGLLAPGGVVDKLLGPTGSVNGLLLALGLSQALQLTPVLLELQNVLNTLAGSGANGASSGGGAQPAAGANPLTSLTSGLGGLTGGLGLGKDVEASASGSTAAAIPGGLDADALGGLVQLLTQLLQPLLGSLTGAAGGGNPLSAVTGAVSGGASASAEAAGASADTTTSTSKARDAGRKLLRNVPLTEAVLAGRRMEA